MIKTFTQTDLIRYIYLETTEEETREIDKALLCDSELQALCQELRSMKKGMDDAQIEPSSSTVLNILSYSRSLHEKRV
jgi:hypothetical protein